MLARTASVWGSSSSSSIPEFFHQHTAAAAAAAAAAAYSSSSSMQEPDHASMLAQRAADSALVLSLLALLVHKVQILRRSRATRSRSALPSLAALRYRRDHSASKAVKY